MFFFFGYFFEDKDGETTKMKKERTIFGMTWREVLGEIGMKVIMLLLALAVVVIYLLTTRP